jgi:hypothetical protein
MPPLYNTARKETNKMKQLNSVIASALVSGLILVSMVGIGVNALTTPGAPANNAAQMTLNSNASLSQQLQQRNTRSTIGTTSNASLRSSQ